MGLDSVSDPFTLYRGYRISIVGAHCHWAFSAEPMSPARPILFRSTIDLTADTADGRVEEAKRYVDDVLAL